MAGGGWKGARNFAALFSRVRALAGPAKTCGSWRGVERTSASSGRLPFHTCQMPLIFFGVRLGFHIRLCLFAVVAATCQFAAAQSSASASGQSEAPTRPSLSGSLENNNGQLRLNLTNNAAREFRGTARLSLGSEAEQREVGQVPLSLPPQQTTLLLITNQAPAGEQYTLLIHDARNLLVFYKIAALKRSQDDAPTIAVALTPITTGAPPKANTAITTPSATDEAGRGAVQVQTRLLADELAVGAFLVSFELSSPQPIDGTLAITVGKHHESKPARVHRQAHYKFKLPEKLASEELINYTLTAKNGRVLAKGAVELAQLMADDSVTVSDIRTDRAAYEAGETARVTVLLEGKGRHGYRLEVLVRDGQGQAFFRAERQAAASETANSPEFAVALSDKISAPLVFEFKVFDPATRLLFDSGEREIVFNKAQPARRP